MRGAPQDEEELRDRLVALVAATAGLRAEDVDVDAPFSSHGLDSPKLAAIAGDLEQALGHAVGPTDVYEFPTVAALAAHLAARPEERGRNAPATSAGAVAVVGIACHFPGADGVEGFWRLLRDGTDAVGEVPTSRWGEGAPAARGGFLAAVDRFDAGFFRIGREEAIRMDPQQRLLLETCWEAFEDAGEVPADLRGSSTSVYVGISVNEYGQRQWQDRSGIGPYSATGNSLAVAANRLSYVFDLRGASVAVDTACSSSLVATHLACQALHAGECERAVVAGVNLLLDPEITIGLAAAGMLSPDGRCKSFDAAADGYGRGEGCGVVILKPLAAAQAAGDRVYAVIRGSAVNSDGGSNGLTAPNPAAQRAVLSSAYAGAGVDPSAVQYVECHGTGTLLGDPIEAGALGALVGAGRAAAPCLIGSVKSNIGHLEAAAGVAGLIKVALSLFHDRLPASLHFARPNPHIAFGELGLEVVTRLRPWPGPAGTRAAGVSGFGFGGTNAHVVLEPAPVPPAAPVLPGPVILPVSARSRAALERSLAGWSQRLQGAPGEEVRALARTAAQRRTHHRPFRAAVVADGPEALAGRVHAEVAEAKRPDPPAAGRPPRVAFVYPGQGVQWQGMARGLLDTDAVFASTIRRCDEVLSAELDWSVEAVLGGRQERDLGDTAVAQPILVAVQLGLTRVWRSLGIQPTAVVGHSVGEISAAVVAGLMDAETGLRLATRRGRLMSPARGLGRMLAVGLSREEAQREADRHGLALAAVNGPRTAVLSGEAPRLGRVREDLVRQGVLARWVEVDYAFHSEQMAPAAAALAAAVEGTAVPFAPSVPFYSSVLGGVLSGTAVDAAYWERNARETVDLAGAVTRLIADGVEALVEVGPSAALLAPLRRLAAGAPVAPPAVLATLDRDHHDRRSLLDAVGRLYVLGCPVRWRHLDPDGGPVAAPPPHPWERQRYWLERRAPQPVHPNGAIGDHPLLGARLGLALDDGRRVWQAAVDPATTPWLADHRVDGTVVLPATASVEIARVAALAAGLGAAVEVEGLALQRAVAFPVDGPVLLQTTLVPDDRGGHALSVHSRRAGAADDAWALHATARVTALGDTTPTLPDLDGVRLRCAVPLAPSRFYELLSAQGLEYGPAFQSLREIWQGEGEAFGGVTAGTSAPAASAGVRLLDAALQLVGGAGGLEAAPSAGTAAVPVALRTVRLWSAPGAATAAHARLQQADATRMVADVALLGGDGRLCAEVLGLELRRQPARPASDPQEDGPLWWYEPGWRERPLATAVPPAAPGRWLVLADRAGTGGALVARLRHLGVPAVSCTPAGSYGRPSADEAQLDPAVPAHYRRLLDELDADPGPPLTGVVHLWGLDEPETSEDAALDPGRATAALLWLVQAVSFAARGVLPRLLVVTRGAQAPDPGGAGVTRPGSTTVWGLLKTLPIENPLLSFRCVDLDPEDDDPATVLLAELGVPESDAEVGYRRGRRYVRRLYAAAPPRRSPQPIARSDATYVVTGGTGGLGLMVAGRLVARGARHVALLARRPESAVAAEVLQEWRDAGAEVRVLPADVRDRDALAGALQELRSSGPAIRGVVHAAGVLADRALLDLTAEDLRSVLEPKVLGGQHLHELTRDDPLDWFALFSSAAGVLGSPGQANYAAANAYLDGLAAHRRQLGLPGVSIDWGPWASAGMAARLAETGEERQLRTAASAIVTADGLDAFERLLGGGGPQTVVLPFDLRNLLQFYPSGAGAAFFDEITTAQVRALKSIGVAPSARHDLANEYVEPRNEVERRIAAIWQRSLGIEPIGVLDSFFELGGDSVFGNQILVEINRALGVTVDPERAFKEFTVAQLAALAEEQTLAQLEDMSDEQAARLLQGRD